MGAAARGPAVASPAATPLRAGRRAAPSLLAIAFLGGLGLATYAFWSRSDLDLFRWPMAELALHGRPLLVYQVHAGIWRSDNGPLSLLPLTAVAAVVSAVGWQADAPLRDAIVMVVFGVFALAFAGEAVRAVQSARGHPLPHSMAVWSALLLGPPLWFGMVSYGHAELPLELWLVLLAVRQLDRGRIAVAGCLLGLALLTQTAVLLAALPLVLLLLSDRRFRATIVLLGTASMTAAAGLLPFLLADGRDLIASLVTYRGQVPALGGSLLTLLPRGQLAAFMQHHDALVFGGAAVVLTWVALRGGRATRPGAPRVYGLMALSSACLPLLAKSAWPYYLADPCVFATIWWLARPGSVDNLRLCVPALFAGASATLLVGAPGICVALAVACGMVLLLADLRGVKFPAITTEPGCAERQGADPAAGARAIST